MAHARRHPHEADESNPVWARFMTEGLYCLIRNMEDRDREAYRLSLRQGQRQRRKARKENVAK